MKCAPHRSPRSRSASTTQRPAPTPTRRVTRTRRGSAVETLNSVVDELIKENRKLKRQLDRLATKATGATGSGIERGLRSILEQVLLDVMYDLPSQANLSRVIVDEATINNDGKPLLMFSEATKVAAAHS